MAGLTERGWGLRLDFAMVLLQAFDGEITELLPLDTFDCRGGGRECRNEGDLVLNCCPADGVLIVAGRFTERRVDDELNLALLDVVDDVRPSFVPL